MVPLVVTVPLAPCVIELTVSESPSTSESLFSTEMITEVFSGVVAVLFCPIGASLIGLTESVTVALLLLCVPLVAT